MTNLYGRITVEHTNMIVGGVNIAHETEALVLNTVNQCHLYQPGCKIST